MSTTTMPGVATFDYAAWSATYPALASSTPELAAQMCFDEATLYLNNSPASVCRDVGRRQMLLYLLTAHIAQLNAQAAAGNGVVGRVSSASRGSVSISTDMGPQTEASAWYNQTPFGARFWSATRNLRLARYVPGRPQYPRIWP